MLKFIIGALVIVLIIWLIARRRNHKSKKPFPQRLIDWLLARELAEEKPQNRYTYRAQAAHRPSAPRRAKPDADQTAYIRPTRRPQPTEITLCYSTEIDGNARYVPVDHLPLCVRRAQRLRLCDR